MRLLHLKNSISERDHRAANAGCRLRSCERARGVTPRASRLHCLVAGIMLVLAIPVESQAGEAVRQQQPANEEAPGSVPLLDDDAAWSKLPGVENASGRRLPAWARALAGSLPRTTAAMLELDYLYRTSDAFDSRLRARMRWVAARANRCEYARAIAEADLLRAGATAQDVAQLAAGTGDLPTGDRAALAFAHKMTLAA
jgi:alkylhydroperoxidase family enzyme